MLLLLEEIIGAIAILYSLFQYAQIIAKHRHVLPKSMAFHIVCLLVAFMPIVGVVIFTIGKWFLDRLDHH